MKKIGLLLACTVVLSGCTPTNGILNEKEVNVPSYEKIKPLIEEQEKISYTPEDVKLFMDELKKINNSIETKEGSNYISMVLDGVNRFGGGNFSYETGVGIYSDDNSKVEFQQLVDALDKTIAKGIKLYLDKNGDVETDGVAKSTKIGRVWIHIKTEESDPNYKEHPDYTEGDEYRKTTSKIKPLKNNIDLRIQIRDVKDDKYKKLVNSVITDDLTLDSIKIGKEKNLITLNNIEFKNGDNSLKQKPLINYELFVTDGEIDKARISIISVTDKKLNDQDLELLEKLSTKFDFKNGDIKILEEIRNNIKNNKNGKSSKTTDRFNFRYSSLEDKSYQFARNMTEIVIEKKK